MQSAKIIDSNMSHTIREEEPVTARVITFNCLSPHYAHKEWFPMAKTKFIDEKYRLDKLCKLIKSWMKSNFIIALQELCVIWHEQVVKICQEMSYHMTYTSYSDGKMGVGIMFPVRYYALLGTDICCPHDEIAQRKSRLLSLVTSNQTELQNAHAIAHAIRDAENPTKPFANPQVTLLLRMFNRGLDTSTELIVSTYHAPCRFANGVFMICHAHRVTEHLRELYDKWANNYERVGFAEPKTIATMFMGDTNSITMNMAYKIWTSGNNVDRVISKDDVQEDIQEDIQDDVQEDTSDHSESADPGVTIEEQDYDPFVDSNKTPCDQYEAVRMAYRSIGIDFDHVVNLRSAYYALNHCEPPFTNVKIADPQDSATENFIETIDYILISTNVNVKSSIVGLTPKDGRSIEAYPNAICPSDHLPLSASLIIT